MAKSDNSKPNSLNPPPFSAKIHPSNDADADPSSYSLEKFRLYETKARFYLIGSDRNKRFFRVLKIDRMEPSDLNISEDPVVYSPQEVKSLLQRIAEGNRATGGLTFVAKVYGIAGCINFLESYYLILVTKRRQIGCICGHAIYSIDESQLITIPHASVQTDIAHSKTELRYKKLLSSVDLTKDFFYSYTYPIMQSLQKNVLSMGEEGMRYENIFVWNAFLTESIRSRCNNTIWTIALVHGHFKQHRLSVFGRDFSVSLISRRSRHFAGTREGSKEDEQQTSYLKRGVNDRGRVANDVETEQIVLDEEAGSCKGKMSSVVQMRGSIPLFWSQEASRFSPKPDIILQRYDPTYEATKLHFQDLAKRYGNPIIVLNLIKTVEKRPREMMLRREFTNAVGYLNQILSEENHLKFIHWDFHKFAKSKSANVLAVLGGVASEALDLTGFYYSGKPTIVKKRATQLSRTSTGRDASLRDLRANSGELAMIGSNNDTLNSLMKQDSQSDSSEQISKDNYGGSAPRFQSGVLRTNCIDCLDRTNVAQYAYGLAALGRQLLAMGLSDTPKLDAECTIAAALMEMYQSMGDALAQQYGGSAAHNTVFPERQGKWKATTQSREFLKSIKRYYSNAYTDGEKQDAINLFLGYFQPQEGKPALWELDSDYYLHVSGIGDDLFIPDNSSLSEAKLMGARTTFAPISACREDFSRLKLTSFDKLIERTCSSIHNVRLFSEPDHKPWNSGVAPDAAEIQLKSPNWLFGQRKYEESNSAPKVASQETANGRCQDEKRVDGLCDLKWLSSGGDVNEKDVFKRYLALTSVEEANGWYGGSLLGDQDENSEIYKHYAELCQGPAIEPFEHDAEKEKYYANLLHMGTIDGSMDDGTAVAAEMEAALKEYDLIGSDLGIVPKTCKILPEDPSQLTRWIIGEEMVQKV
ncbi:phosphoinositide phosphatase SAC1 isoform X1 [Camellia sinensis]|uniref:phosphoinositide phosphatase SAC1 isoform X1 n=1 Tax=Camellia sinensis TaxID=4442 RepID=UPI00103564AA|nr:phosphoinositide phosphatase SAC1 isoform X1 [Camellia sinensis]